MMTDTTEHFDTNLDNLIMHAGHMVVKRQNEACSDDLFKKQKAKKKQKKRGKTGLSSDIKRATSLMLSYDDEK